MGVCLSLGAALPLSDIAYAGAGVWTTGGPHRGPSEPWPSLSRLQPPSTLESPGGSGPGYSGSYVRVFKSSDSPGTWAARSTGLPTHLDVDALVITPAW